MLRARGLHDIGPLWVMGSGSRVPAMRGPMGRFVVCLGSRGRLKWPAGVLVSSGGVGILYSVLDALLLHQWVCSMGHVCLPHVLLFRSRDKKNWK